MMSRKFRRLSHPSLLFMFVGQLVLLLMLVLVISQLVQRPFGCLNPLASCRHACLEIVITLFNQ
jgi:hypothetical protein